MPQAYFHVQHMSIGNPIRDSIHSVKCAAKAVTTGGQSVVVVGPISDLALFSTHNRDTRDRNRNPSGESTKKRFRECDLKHPLRDHMIAIHEYLISLQRVIWIKLTCFLEELG